MSCNKCSNQIKLLKNQIKKLSLENNNLKNDIFNIENDNKIKFLNFIKNLVKENKYYNNKFKEINELLEKFHLILNNPFNSKLNNVKNKQKFIGSNNSNSYIKDYKKTDDWLKYLGKDNFKNYQKEYIKNFNLYHKINLLSRDSDSLNFYNKNRSQSSDDKNIKFDSSLIFNEINENNKNSNWRNQIKNWFIKN